MKIGYPNPQLGVFSTPARGLVSFHTSGINMLELSPFDAEELGRTLIDAANDCLANPSYVPADEAPEPVKIACETCGHDREMHRIDGPNGADYSIGCGVPLCPCSAPDFT